MKKRINPQEYYLTVDKGYGRIHIQNGVEYDRTGLSLEDFPDPVPVKEVVAEFVLSKLGRPYVSQKMAESVIRMKKEFSSTTHVAVPYDTGYAITTI